MYKMGVDWLNYHHLYYFWVVAKAGSIAAATKKLRLAQPTLSGQIRQLEETLEAKLFAREGRRLVLTDTGRLVLSYAEEIFTAGQDMIDAVKGLPTDRPIRFHVGVAMVIPKLVAYRLLEDVLKMPERVVPVCVEGRLESLLAKLSLHELDLVLSDTPIPPMISVKAYNHFLGESGVSFLGVAGLCRKFRKNFPQSLREAPVLLPTEGTSLRRSLTQWFEQNEIRPNIVGEFQDSALLKVFGQRGHGVFPIPSMMEKDVRKQYGVELVGRVPGVKESFYAISVERTIKHPAIRLISERAQTRVFQA